MHNRKREPQPKDAREESPVEESLNRLNQLDYEATQRMRHGAKRHDTSVLILMDKAYEQQRKLLHEYGVIPVVDERSGGWKLFE